MIIDTHVHYDDGAFDEDRTELLECLQANGIEAVVNIGANCQTSKNTLELIRNYPWIYGVIGVHPSDSQELTEDKIEWLRRECSNPKVVAVGEIGLDYYWEEPDREIQRYWFIRQLNLARQVQLPVVIHSRDAAKDTLDIMKEEKCGEIGGVIHCFSYGVEMAREYLQMGFYLGIGGVLTFNNAKKLKEVVAYTPMDRIVLETDSPYLAPAPNRGKRNSSLNLPYVVEKISEIKSISQAQVMEITNQNAKRLYGIKGTIDNYN